MSDPKELWKQYKKGENLALNRLLDGERETFYNYLLRMTGEISPSFDSMQEIFSTAINSQTKVRTLNAFRVELYQTGRKFNADLWNRNNNFLRNPSIDEGVDDETFVKLDQIIQEFDQRKREVIVLHLICGFDLRATAKIMGATLQETETALADGLLFIDSQFENLNDTESKIKELPLHVPPMATMNETVDLGQVVRSMKTTRWGSRLKQIILLALIGLGIFIYFNPEILGDFLDMWEGPNVQVPD